MIASHIFCPRIDCIVQIEYYYLNALLFDLIERLFFMSLFKIDLTKICSNHTLMITEKGNNMSITRLRSNEKVSRIVIHNETVYLCGQVALDVTEDIVGQTKSVLARIDDHLEEAGSSREKMLSALIHIKDNKDVGTFNELWNEWLPEGCAPARSCVQSVMARDVVLVEVTVIAAL